jgi:ribosomal protein S18 acetylase RimI-like enzyme
MYKILKCSEVTDNEIFKAFNAGFIDYMIQITMEEEEFINRFFGAEGNDRALSFIAYNNDDKSVGIILGGLKTNETLKTLRCGGMCVVPEERGSGLAYELMRLHFEEAKRIGCEQLFLEVINGNDRAVTFYKKLGYEKVYDLTYRSLEVNPDYEINLKKHKNIKIESITFDELKEIRIRDFSHLPWQYSFEYFSQLETKCYGVKVNDTIIAGLATSGIKILYLWVHPAHRRRGLASHLVNRMIQDNKPEKITMAYTNNSEIHTYASKLGMKMDEISQFEMYKSI